MHKEPVLNLRLIVLLFLAPHFSSANEFVIWNVGQGSWSTEITERACIHYDIGGENFPRSSLLDSCKKKSNIIALSHLDWDHVSFLKKSRQVFRDSCLVMQTDDPRTQKFFSKFSQLKICDLNFWQAYLSLTLDNPKDRRPNFTSDVYFSNQHSVLLPGDLPGTLEKRIPESSLRRTKILVLAHHGSATSTTKKMLMKMSNLQMTVASARFAKYRHPHIKTKALLGALRIPLLRTEDWGHIHFLKGPHKPTSAAGD